mgnify:CR=1 FL=1
MSQFSQYVLSLLEGFKTQDFLANTDHKPEKIKVGTDPKDVAQPQEEPTSTSTVYSFFLVLNPKFV